MKKSLLFLYLQTSFFFSFAQYCTSGGPSSADDSNVQSVYFDGISSDINYTGSCVSVGVEDATFMMADVSAGFTYDLTVQFGTCGGNYYGVGTIWIDWNQNSFFETTEEVGVWSGTPPTSASDYSVTVPIGAANGITRMRVMQWEGGSYPLDPCGFFAWGSVIDFSINVGGGMDCSGYNGDTFLDAIDVPSIPYTDTNSTAVCYSNNFTVYPSADVYYRFITNPIASSVKVSLCNSSFDTYLSILNSSGAVISYNDDGVCGNNSELVVSAGPSDTLYAVVEGWNTAQGQYIIKIEDVTGQEEFQISNFKYQIYPNPASSGFTISSEEEMTKVELLTVSGQLKETWTPLQKQLQVTNSHLENGIYFIRIFDQHNQPVLKKLVINHNL